jgi:hypothetical protein
MEKSRSLAIRMYVKFISSSSGISLLRQFKTRFEVHEGITILSGLKKARLHPSTSASDLDALVGRLSTLFDGRVLFSPLQAKITQIKERIEHTHPDASSQEQYEEMKFQLLHSKIPGSTQCLLDDMIGMLREIKKDLSLDRMKWNITKALDPKYGATILSPTPADPIPKEQMLATRFPEHPLAQKLNVLIVAYECATFGLKYGGLGEAIYGMAKGLSQSGHKVTMLLPYFDKLPDEQKRKMQMLGQVSHRYGDRDKTDKILGIEDGSLSVRYVQDVVENEDIDHFAVETAHALYEDGPLADEEQPWLGLKHRMAYFSSAAQGYISEHAEHIDAVMYNDWHAAYATTLEEKGLLSHGSRAKHLPLHLSYTTTTMDVRGSLKGKMPPYFLCLMTDEKV